MAFGDFIGSGGFSFLTGAVKTYAIVQAGKQQKRAQDFNAAVAAQQGEQARDWARYNEQRERRKQKFRRGQMVVDLLKNGISIDEGTTPDLLLMEQEIQDEMDALAIRNQGLSRQAQLLSRASFFKFQGAVAESTSKIAAIGTVLETAGRVTVAQQQQKIT